MRSDLELITKKFPDDMRELRVYAIGDVHVGSPEFDERAIKAKIQRVADDPAGLLALCGDLGNFGLRSSISNPYLEKMDPAKQIEYIYKLFEPVKEKIIAAVPGNHEERVTKEVGTCPLYDLCVRWGIQDVYRENVAIVKLVFGIHHGKQQNTFIGVVTHGSSRARHKKFIAGFDGIDFAISGHTHTPEYSPHGRIRVNSIKETAMHVPYKEIVVDANMKPGGYGLKKEYEILPPPELQYLELSTYREANRNRTVHRSINYHSIQI